MRVAKHNKVVGIAPAAYPLRRRTTVFFVVLAVGVWAAVQLRLDPRDLWTGAGTTAVLARFFSAAVTPAWVSERRGRNSRSPLLPGYSWRVQEFL